MENSRESGALGLVVIITILISIFSGVFAWNLVEPKTFWGGVGFLILWGVFSKIGHYIAMFIGAIFIDK